MTSSAARSSVFTAAAGSSRATSTSASRAAALSSATRFRSTPRLSSHTAACGSRVKLPALSPSPWKRRAVRLAREPPDALAQPVEAPRRAGLVRHALLHDAPVARRGEHERVVVELVARLHGAVVDLRGELAGPGERRRIAAEPLASR